MNFKRNLGIGFIFLSIIISAANMNMTGAVIGSSLSNLFSFVALVFFIGGIGLFMSERERKKSIAKLVGLGIPISQINKIEVGIKGTYPISQRKEIYREVETVLDEVKSGTVGGPHNLHVLRGVPPGLGGTSAKRMLEADAKILNKYQGQGGRGTERYIFDNSTRKLLGIAHHARGGRPGDLQWRKRF